VVTVTVALLHDRKPLTKILSPLLFNDFGNLLFTFTMLWAYLSFSQYLIIWSGNLPDETQWYRSRASGGWAWVAVLLIVFHFAVPFVLLLMRFIKRRARVLAAVAAGLMVMSAVDIYWLTVPAFASDRSVGLESGKMMGRSTLRAISRTMASENAPPAVERPIRIVASIFPITSAKPIFPFNDRGQPVTRSEACA